MLSASCAELKASSEAVDGDAEYKEGDEDLCLDGHIGSVVAIGKHGKVREARLNRQRSEYTRSGRSKTSKLFNQWCSHVYPKFEN